MTAVRRQAQQPFNDDSLPVHDHPLVEAESIASAAGVPWAQSGYHLRPVEPLTHMSLLLTNDDGIDAPGLAALHDVVQRCGEITIVAPQLEQSGVAHRVTDTHPIAVQSRDARRFAVAGTPADCARLGLLHLAPGTQWLLAGINAGGNLGSDIYMSGTVAAAREAALLGTSAVALSQYRTHLQRPLDWARAAGWVHRVLQHLFEQSLAAGEFWNVNLPDPDDPAADPQIVHCAVDPGHHALAYEQTPEGWVYRGKYRERHRQTGCDVDVCFSGNIAVSRIATR